jgi:hypothetical protein
MSTSIASGELASLQQARQCSDDPSRRRKELNMHTVPAPTVRGVHHATALALLLVSVAVLVFAATGAVAPVRLLLVTLFALTAPGWAIVAFWRPASAAMEWTVAICLSLAIIIVLGMTMLLLSAWYPSATMAVLAVVTAAVLGFHLVRTNLTGWATA